MYEGAGPAKDSDLGTHVASYALGSGQLYIVPGECPQGLIVHEMALQLADNTRGPRPTRTCSPLSSERMSAALRRGADALWSRTSPLSPPGSCSRTHQQFAPRRRCLYTPRPSARPLKPSPGKHRSRRVVPRGRARSTGTPGLPIRRRVRRSTLICA
ncbi:hypothetical protein VTO73DRAFT_5435 [Trametes versicolor]